jgi:hypothetical protein
MEVKAIERFLYVLRQLFDDYDLADQEIDSTGAPNFWAKGDVAFPDPNEVTVTVHVGIVCRGTGARLTAQ